MDKDNYRLYTAYTVIVRRFVLFPIRRQHVKLNRLLVTMVVTCIENHLPT